LGLGGKTMQLKDLKHLTQDNLIELLIKDDNIRSLNLEDELILHLRVSVKTVSHFRAMSG
jgi:hypothetical protein